MTLESARVAIDRLKDKDGTPRTAGYCVPLSIDSLLKHTELPQHFYDYFKAHNESGSVSLNEAMTHLLQEFFNVDPAPATPHTAVAEYNAFGASVQPYCPDVPYEYPDDVEAYANANFEAMAEQFRLDTLLGQTAALNCLTLIRQDNNVGGHVVALENIDKGGGEYPSLYMIRNSSTRVEGSERLYRKSELTGLSQLTTPDGYTDTFAPLPRLSRPYYPTGKSSWSLLVLPPEPK